MCRPPDPFSHLTSPNAMTVEAVPAPMYGGQGLEFPPDVYAMNEGNWEQDIADDGNAQGGEYSWEWPQQVQGASFMQANNIQKMDAASVQTQNCRPVMTKQPRVRVNGGTNVPSSLIHPTGYSSSWKYQQMYQDGQPGHTLPWTGTSMPYPPMQYPLPTTKSASMMAGPSMVGPTSRRMTAAPPGWSKQDGIGKWIKPVVPGAQAAQYTIQSASKKEDLHQAKPWDALTADVEHNEDADGCDDNNLSDDDDAVKEKKMRRMLSNRASAKRSRQRRQERLGELEILTAKLRVENATVTRKYAEALEQVEQYQRDNECLTLELQAVRSELESLKSNKQEMDGCSKQESGKASVQSRFNCDEESNEGHSLKVEQNVSPSVTSLKDKTCLKASPVSDVTKDVNDCNGNSKEVASLLEDNMEIGTDDWFENLVHCLDD